MQVMKRLNKIFFMTWILLLLHTHMLEFHTILVPTRRIREFFLYDYARSVQIAKFQAQYRIRQKAFSFAMSQYKATENTLGKFTKEIFTEAKSPGPFVPPIIIIKFHRSIPLL